MWLLHCYTDSSKSFPVEGYRKEHCSACITALSTKFNHSLLEWEMGMSWCSWLRYCATSQKVVHSIPNGGHWLNTSGHTVALGSIRPHNRNEYQGYLPGGKGGQCIGLTTLPPSCADCLEILGASTSWSAKGLSRPVQGWQKQWEIFSVWLECVFLENQVSVFLQGA
jgi:hypothetical protein